MNTSRTHAGKRDVIIAAVVISVLAGYGTSSNRGASRETPMLLQRPCSGARHRTPARPNERVKEHGNAALAIRTRMARRLRTSL
jgi:hypothetical protein